jgi:hypothetical protein
MSVTITMLQTRRGEDGTLWLAGADYVASETFAQLLITANMASGPPRPAPSEPGPLTSAQVVNLFSPRLTQIPYIASGFALPVSGALTNTIGSGDATINGVRVIMAATALTFPASRDNYVDLTQAGAYVVVSVANGATTGMTQTPNSLRVGKVVTGASTISGATTNAKDALGNWMGNLSPLSLCYLATTFVSYQAATAMPAGTAGSEVYDNDTMHSISVNNSRITINKPGLYRLSASVFNSAPYTETYVSLYKNGSVISNGQNRQSAATAIIYAGFITLPPIALVAGDYIEGYLQSGVAGCSAAGGTLSAERIA